MKMPFTKMSTSIAGVCGLALAALSAAPAAHAGVSVQFVEPEHFADAGAYGRDRDRTLAALERHFQALGARCLPASQELALRVTDVDLAGWNEYWWRPGQINDLRVLRPVTYPAIELEFDLRDAQGQRLDAGSERLTDLGYQSRAPFLRYRHDALAYEKAMVSDWFEARFCRQG